MCCLSNAISPCVVDAGLPITFVGTVLSMFLGLALAHDARRHLAHGTTSSHLALVSTSTSTVIASS
jgi:hypothetical protein